MIVTLFVRACQVFSFFQSLLKLDCVLDTGHGVNVGHTLTLSYHCYCYLLGHCSLVLWSVIV